MNPNFRSDRRLVKRYDMKTPLRVRVWKTATPDVMAESINLSQRGIYFATESELRKGETVEIFFNMPEEIIGEPTTEWRCTGHVVRVEEKEASANTTGVGVQFDCYEVSKSKRVDVATAVGQPAPIRDMVLNGEETLKWKKERLLSTMNLPPAS